MSFDLSQLLQGPMRDLVLNQVTKQLGISNENGGNLLNKGLSMVLGGMTQKASSAEGAKGLFDLIKNTNIQGNPLDMLTGKADAATTGGLLDLGKNILPSLFGDRANAITDLLASSTKTSPAAAKGILGMLLPVVFSFFKGKIASGLGLGGLLGLLGSQTKALASNFDSQSLSALGFAGNSIDDVLGNLTKVSGSLDAATATVKNVVASEAKSSGLGKWLIAGAAVLAALLGIKSCNDKDVTTATPAPAAQTAPAQQTAPAAPATETAKVSEGLGNLSWLKTAADLTVSGTVQNDATKSNILDAFKGLAADLPLVDKLVVDANADQFSFNNFAGLAGLFKEFPNVNGSFADKALNLAGQVASFDDKSNLVGKAQELLGNVFSINADNVTVEEAEADEIADMSAANIDLEIVFATGSSQISPRYYRRLNSFAKYVSENNIKGEIAGYTDNTGDATQNQQLSEKRANAVREYLIQQGVPAEALTAVGHGQENPIADNGTEEGRRKNRRIEFNAR